MAFTALLLAALLSAGDRLVIPWVVAGHSMEPALWPGDRLLIDRWTFRQRAPRVGELVLFEGPSGTPLVKRVAGPPRHAPTYPELWGAGDGGPVHWVLGDHPEMSRDSRHFGLVPSTRIRGRVVLRYWPPSRGRIVRRASPHSYISSTR